MFSLIKINEPGSLRFYGELPSGLPPHRLPIAGKSYKTILSNMGYQGYRIKGISTRNAFVAYGGGWVYYLFVRPKYTSYRWLATRRFGTIPLDHEVDHILSRNLAEKFNFNYVLIGLIFKRVNRSHGHFEKYFQVPQPHEILFSQVCFPDHRILDKILGRRAKARRPIVYLNRGYGLRNKLDLGLTLKQKGIWNLSFGFHQPPPDDFIHSLIPI